MFFNHNLTDQELIRAAQLCEGQPLRLLAARLGQRVDQLHRIQCICETTGEPENAIDLIEEITKER